MLQLFDEFLLHQRFLIVTQLAGKPNTRFAVC
jgi:hypothetical protein